jgi:hypothetical protein
MADWPSKKAVAVERFGPPSLYRVVASSAAKRVSFNPVRGSGSAVSSLSGVWGESAAANGF